MSTEFVMLWFIYTTEDTNEDIFLNSSYCAKYYEKFDLMVFAN